MKHQKPPTAKEIKSLMKEFNLKQHQAASHAGVELRTMQRYLAEDIEMSIPRWQYMQRNIFESDVLLEHGAIKGA